MGHWQLLPWHHSIVRGSGHWLCTRKTPSGWSGIPSCQNTGNSYHTSITYIQCILLYYYYNAWTSYTTADCIIITSTNTSSCWGLMVVLPFDLFPSLPADPVGVGREWGVEGVVGRWDWGESAPSDIGEAGRGDRGGELRGKRSKPFYTYTNTTFHINKC